MNFEHTHFVENLARCVCVYVRMCVSVCECECECECDSTDFLRALLTHHSLDHLINF